MTSSKTIICCMVGTLLAACSSAGTHSDSTAAGPRPIDVAMPEVDSVTLHRTFPGLLSAEQSADVVARVSGVILAKKYDDGQMVTKGQPLFIIESLTYADAVRQAEAALATARSQYDYYSRQYDAMKRALQADAVSQMDVIQSESSMRQAEASIKSAEAQLRDARTNLGYCTVTAPISGHITSPTLDVGNFVAGGAQPVKLATIYNDRNMSAVFSVEDSQYEQMVGANGGTDAAIYRAVPVVFTDTLTHSYTANIFYASPAVDTSTGTLTLKGRIANPYDELKDGMYATISLPYGTEPHAILIKDASIATDQLGKYVYTVDDSNRVVYTPIEIGEVYRDSMRIVNKGLTPESRYVTKALLTVRNGETVRPVMTK